MNAAHTPGPWAVRQWHDNISDTTGFTVVGPDGAMLPESEMSGDIEEAEANATLKAAAPELLEALRALELLFAPLARDSTQKGWIYTARDVIAKATGATP